MKDKPAFPNNAKNWPDPSYIEGMTLKQWYAGMALQGLLSNPQYKPKTTQDLENFAETANKQAEAMIKHQEQ